MSRHTDRLHRLEDRLPAPHKVWSRADYLAGRESACADMLAAFDQALSAVGIRFLLEPYLELRDGRPVMLFKIILDIPLPAKPNPHILA